HDVAGMRVGVERPLAQNLAQQRAQQRPRQGGPREAKLLDQRVSLAYVDAVQQFDDQHTVGRLFAKDAGNTHLRVFDVFDTTTVGVAGPSWLIEAGGDGGDIARLDAEVEFLAQARREAPGKIHHAKRARPGRA